MFSCDIALQYLASAVLGQAVRAAAPDLGGMAQAAASAVAAHVGLLVVETSKRVAHLGARMAMVAGHEASS